MFKIPEVYLPLQPGLENNKDYNIKLKFIHDAVNKSIIIFYQFNSTKFTESTFILPGGCIDILFCCNPQNPTADCYGTVLKSKPWVFKADYDYFGVRYLPEQGIHLMKELIDKDIPLLDIISADFSIIEKVVNAKSFEERIEFFIKCINNSILRLTYIPSLVKYSIEKIYSAKGNIGIDQLALETGYSVAYLRKKFEEIIGVSPKLFCEIVRFQNSLSMIIKRSECNLWDVISENGYYDQAHLIHQFKKFGTLTPAKFKDNFARKTSL